ncbi:hypothetical protein M378DRAFT_1031598 [Amanita muscaria Koide BX008]|uniref:Uncharacterized protein n=1 Tax=Amanita muscaria (strain Koide BX008) TaxID=946122 RepID=A0A0C2WK42_AMAMK|nr:hypothetical protein M378DRAFT_1031598 [Amanita muscaria Koide BX008]
MQTNSNPHTPYHVLATPASSSNRNNQSLMDLADLAINATPSFESYPLAEDEKNLFADVDPCTAITSDTQLTPVLAQQPALQASARKQPPPPYGYHFPLATSYPVVPSLGSHYPSPTPVNYGNQTSWSPHHGPGYIIHHGQYGQPPSPRVATPPPPNVNKRDHSLSPKKPKKRGRGGGPGSRGGRGSYGGRGGFRGPGSVKSNDQVKETEVTETAKVEIIEDDEVFTNSRWTDDDRTALFEYYLGPESDEIYEKLKINASRVHEKASKVLLGGKYSVEAIKGQYTRAYDTFTYILALEGFTGGGGDGDENPDDSDSGKDPMDKKISLARLRGVALGSLTAKTCHKWQSNGWYDLFVNRMGKSSKVTRPVVQNSCAPLSDVELTILDSESSDDSRQSSKHSKRSKSSKPSSKSKAGSRNVSEPKHSGAKGFRVESRGSLSAIDRLVELKASTEELRIKRMNLQQNTSESQRKLEVAKTVLEMDNLMS